MPEREVRTFSFEEFHKLLFGDKPYIPPFSGVCIMCGTNLVKGLDTDHSVCNNCWTATFACETCGDETGECVHVNPEDYEPDDPGEGTYVDV